MRDALLTPEGYIPMYLNTVLYSIRRPRHAPGRLKISGHTRRRSSMVSMITTPGAVAASAPSVRARPPSTALSPRSTRCAQCGQPSAAAASMFARESSTK
jgi:hypothetical protein